MRFIVALMILEGHGISGATNILEQLRRPDPEPMGKMRWHGVNEFIYE